MVVAEEGTEKSAPQGNRLFAVCILLKPHAVNRRAFRVYGSCVSMPVCLCRIRHYSQKVFSALDITGNNAVCLFGCALSGRVRDGSYISHGASSSNLVVVRLSGSRTFGAVF